MGENQGRGDKSPNSPDRDLQGSSASNAGSQQSQRDMGSQQSGRQQSGSQQSDRQQSGSQQSDRQQDIDSQRDSQQNVGNQQSGQRQNQQKGGQHASGGTPALDDLEPSNKQADWNNQQDKQR